MAGDSSSLLIAVLLEIEIKLYVKYKAYFRLEREETHAGVS